MHQASVGQSCQGATQHTLGRSVGIAVSTILCLLSVSAVEPGDQESNHPSQTQVNEHLEAGEEALTKGDFKKAVLAFSKALELSEGSSTRALHGLGTSHLSLSNLDQAEQCGRKILKLSEAELDVAAAENLIGAALLGKALQTTNQRESQELLTEAESHLRISLSVSSGRMTAAWQNLSTALRHQDKAAEARDAQQEYVNRNPENLEARGRLCALKFLAADSNEEPLPETIRKVEGEVLPPKKIYSPAPPYTEAAREAGIQGVVKLVGVIDSFGTVSDLRVRQGLSMGLTKSAALTACEWRFEPATIHGEPVPVQYSLTIRFSIQKR